MKISSWNVNGIRSIYKKGYLEWFNKYDYNFVCLQEIRAEADQFPPEIVNVKGYTTYINPAVKKGYSGTAIYTKHKPLSIETEIGYKRFDDEGRILKLNYKNFSLLNIYVPNGGSNKEALQYKFDFFDYFIKYLRNIKENIIIVGDINIAHREIDLARPDENKNKIMFTPKEREQIDKLIDLDLVDSFRKFNIEKNQYTWWPYFANARQRNLGWRIDYIFTHKNIEKNLTGCQIHNNVLGSDHCPISAEYNLLL